MNSSVLFSTGQYVVYLDPWDKVGPNATRILVDELRGAPSPDAVYGNESSVGRPTTIYSRPDWSPDRLLGDPYIGGLLCIRRRIVLDFEGPRMGGISDFKFALLLRLRETEACVRHVPSVLTIRGESCEEEYGVPTVDLDPEITRAALQRHFARIGEEVRLEEGDIPGRVRIRRVVERAGPVTLLLLSCEASRTLAGVGEVILVRRALERICAISTYQDYRILLVHTVPLTSETRDLLQRLNVRAIPFSTTSRFNFAQAINFGLKQVDTEHVIIINDDIEITTPDWIEALLEWSVDSGIGAVGAKLVYPDGSLQHGGISLVPRFGATHSYYKLSPSTVGYGGGTHTVTNVSAVTAALMATKMSVLDEIGYFDERLSTDFNDVDLCLKMRQRGYRVVYTPYSAAVHYENSSFQRSVQNSREASLFTARWEKLLERDAFTDMRLIRAYAPELIDPTGGAPLD